MPYYRCDGAGGASRRPLVAHILSRFDMGGLETVMVELINATAADALRHVVICLTDYSEFRERISVPGVECYALGKRPGKDPAVYWRLWRLFRRLRPDVVQTYNIGTIDAAVPARLAGIRAIVHAEHGRNADDPLGLNRKYNLLRRMLNPLIGRYIVVSMDLDLWLVEVVGLPSKKVTRIYNGVDVTRYALVEASERERRSILPEHFAVPGSTVFINVGRLDPVKDQAGLIRAFTGAVRELGADGVKLRLVIVGDGPEGSALKNLARASGVSPQILLMGSRGDVPRLLTAADVFVSSSIAEGIAMTILEAMACARPVIATAVGGNPEVVVDGQTGMLVPAQAPQMMSAAMCRYAVDRELVWRHGIAGRTQVVERFNLHQMVRSYVELYSELTRSASPPRERVT